MSCRDHYQALGGPVSGPSVQERRQRLGLTSINSVLEPTCCLKHRRKFSSVGRICASCGDQRVRVTSQPCQGRSEDSQCKAAGESHFVPFLLLSLRIGAGSPLKGKEDFLRSASECPKPLGMSS